jgi:hypothetical protein
MKNKTAVKIQELIDYMSLNEYRSQSTNKVVHKKQRVLSLETNDILLASNKLLNVHLEAITKKLEAHEVAKLLSNGVICDYCEQAHECGACLQTSPKFFKE